MASQTPNRTTPPKYYCWPVRTWNDNNHSVTPLFPARTRALPFLGALVGLAGVLVAAPLQVDVARTHHASVNLRLRGKVLSESPVEVRLLSSQDLKTWRPTGNKLRLPAGSDANGAGLGADSSSLRFYRLSVL